MLNAKHLIFATTLFALWLTASAQWPHLIPFYQDSYYQGAIFDPQCLNCVFTNLGPYGWNDRVSSLIVPAMTGNHTWANMFDLTNYGGEYRTFGANTGWGSAMVYDLITYRFNDKMASLSIHSMPMSDTPTLTIYEDVNYGGASLVLYPHSYSTLADYGWANRISSLKLGALGKTTLWKFPSNYSGSTLQYNGGLFTGVEVPSMPSGWNDAINCIVFGTV